MRTFLSLNKRTLRKKKNRELHVLITVTSLSTDGQFVDKNTKRPLLGELHQTIGTDGRKGNEMADLYMRRAAESELHAVDRPYLCETRVEMR